MDFKSLTKLLSNTDLVERIVTGAEIARKSHSSERRTTSISRFSTAVWSLVVSCFFVLFGANVASATSFTETVPNGNGPIPNTYPAVGGTMFVFVGANGNIYYQFVNPSTQFQGFQLTGNPASFQGAPKFQLGPTQALNCGTVSCSTYFGGSIVEGYARLTARDADACDASTGSSGGNNNFDYQDVYFEVNGIRVSSLSDLPANSVERTNFAGTSTIGTENCFRNQNSSETSTSWFDLTGVPGLLSDVLATGSTTPVIHDDDGWTGGRGDNYWYFRDGNDATGTPEVAPGITIVKTSDVSSYTAVGDIINYSFEVTNIGSVFLTNVAVTDSFITGAISCPQNTLVTGESMICTGQHVVTQANIDNDEVFVNTAETTAVPTEGTIGSVSGTLTIPGPAAENKGTISKKASKDVGLVLNETITYTYEVTNNGNITWDNVSISDTHGGTGTLSAVTPASVTLAPGASQTFTATYQITQADVDAGVPIKNTATFTADPRRGTFTPPSADESVETVEGKPELKIGKSAATLLTDADGSTDVTAGDTLEYTVSVGNAGNVTLNNVVVSDPQLTPNTITCATVAPGATCELTGTHVVTQAEADASNVENTASVKSDEVPGPTDSNTVNTPVEQDADLTIVKSPATLDVDADGSTDVTAGDTLEYTVTVTNTGNVTLNNVDVTDGQLTPGTTTCATIAPGATCVLTGTHVVTQAEANAGNVENTASVTSDEVAGPTDSNTVDTPVEQNPAFTVVKSAATLLTDADSSTDVTEGDTLEYTVTVENTGNVTLNNVSVSDPQLTPSSTSCATVAPGAICVLTGTHIVTQAEADAGNVQNTASASSDEVPATDSNTVDTPVEQDPSQTIVKSAATLLTDADSSTDVTAGDTLEYTVTVENTGNVTLNNIVVSDAQLTPASTTCASVAPGASCVLTGTHIVTQTEADAGNVQNTASVTSNELPPEDSNTVDTPVEQNPSLTIAKSAATLDVDADGTTDVTAGDTLEYTVTVENTGDITLTNVLVSDAQLTPASTTCATVAPGATCVLTGTHVVTQAEADAGNVANTASVDTNETTPEDSNTVDTPVEQDPALTIAKSAATLDVDADGSTDVTEGDTLEYTVTVENTGNVTLTNVQVTDGQLTPSLETCASVAPGATCVLTGTHVVTQAEADSGQVVNTASVDSNETTPEDSNTVTTPVEQDPATSIAKSAATLLTDADSSTDVTAGDTLEYTVTVENTGNVTLTNVQVTDGQLTPGLETCASVAPGATCVLTGTHVVTQAEADAGVVVNTASVDSNETTPEDSNTVNTPVEQDPTLTIVKSAATLDVDADTSTDVTAGDTLEYTVTVENTGNVTLTNVLVSDAQLTPASTTCASVAPGATCVLTGTHVVTQAEADAGNVANTASVDTNETTPEDSNTVNTPVEQDPSLTIAKSAATLDVDADGSTDVTAGDTLEYTVTVENTGNVTLTNVLVSDAQLTPASTTCASVAPGATCVLTGTHVVTQAEADAGNVENTASVDTNETPPEDSNTVDTPVEQDPSLTIAKSAATLDVDADGSTDVTAGDTLEYTVTVENTGNVTLNNVVVSDAQLTPASTNCATVAPGATCVLTGTHVVSQTEADAGVVVNTASVDSNETAPEDSNTVNTPVEQDPSQTIVKSAATLLTDADGNGEVSAGDTLEYTVTVENTGNVTLNAVTVSDAQLTPGSITCPVVNVGATCVLTGTHVVTPAEEAAGEVVNTASVVSDEIPGPTDSNTVNEPINSPGMTLTKGAPVLTTDADGNGELSVGDTITYTVTANNSGTMVLTDVVVEDLLLSPASSVTCPTLAVGADCVLTGTYVVTAADVTAGQIVNNATGNSDQTPEEEADHIEPLNQPALEIVKPAPVLTTDADANGEVSAGDTLTYTITVTNTGTAALTDVVINDALITPNTTTCALVAPTDTCVLTGTYIVTAADVTAGQIENNATGNSDQTGEESADHIEPIETPGLTLVKPAPVLTTDADGNSEISVGDTITYTVTATNSGTMVLTDVVVEDLMLSPTSETCTTLAVGADCVLTGTYVVTAADVTAGQIVNNATGNSDQTDEETADNTEPLNSPAMTLTKGAPVLTTDADGNAELSVGDTITYTVTANNSGTMVLTDVVVEDLMLTPSSQSCATLAVGADCVLTGTYVVTAADVTAGQIVNNATGNSDQTPEEDASHTETLNAPAMTLTKGAPVLTTDADVNGEVSEGDTLTYTVIVNNSGSMVLTDVVVEDLLITPSSATCATLAVGADCVLTGTYVVTAADVTAGQIVNNATGNSDQTVEETGDNTQPINMPGLGVAKALSANADEDGNGEISVGDTLTYTVTASNTGAAVLTNVVVTDTLITPSTTTCATLAVGADCVLTGTYVVTQADVDAGFIENTGGADSNQTDPVDDTINEPINAPLMELSKPAPVLSTDADANGEISVGDTLTYTITATNSGAAVLTDVVINDSLITPNTTTCALVAAGDTCVLTGTYVVTAADVAAGTVDNSATGNSDQTSEVSDDEQTPLNMPAMTLTKGAPVLSTDADGNGEVSEGDTLTYTVTANNSGTMVLTDVIVEDLLLTPTSETCTTLAVGADCVLTGTYVVTAADVTAGQIVNNATGNSDQTPEETADNTQPLNAPEMTLTKSAPVLTTDLDNNGELSVGDTITYTVTVNNSGTMVLTDVVVEDLLLTPTTETCTTLAVGADCVLTGTYVVTSADVTAGQIVNTATGNSDQTPESDADNTQPLNAPETTITKPAPVLTTDADANGEISEGDTLTYTITLENTGTAVLTNVVVTDNLITPNTNNCGLVLPGDSCVLTGTYAVTAADITAGVINNTATGDSAQTDPQTDDEITPINQPEIDIVKPAPVLTTDADSNGEISVGDTLTYTITATNTGTAALTNVVVNDNLITPSAETCALVAPAETCILTGTYVVTAADVTAGTIDNSATVNSDQTPEGTAENMQPLNAPSMVIAKALANNADEDANGEISVGDTLTYTVTATNDGSMALSNVVVTDNLITPNTETCTLLAVNDNCTLTGTYVVTQADVDAGFIENTGGADSDQTDPIEDTINEPINAPALELTKAMSANADEDGNGELSVGDTLTYTVTATNTGAAALSNVTINDSLITPNTTTCALVAVGDTCVLTGTYVVTVGDVSAGEIVNTATATSDQTGEATADDTQELNAPALALVKAAPVLTTDADSNGEISEGDTLTYTVTATNSGSMVLTFVILEDLLLIPTTEVCDTLAVGADCVLTGTYVVTAADVAAGEIVNNATANSDQTGETPADNTQPLNMPALEINKPAPTNADEDGDGFVSAGDTLTYTVTATNTGSMALSNVMVTDNLITPNATTCTLVPAGETCVLTGTYTATQADIDVGTILNEASAESDQTDSVSDDNTVEVAPMPSMELTKSAVNMDFAVVGDTIDYSYEVVNTGNVTISDLSVSDDKIPTVTCPVTTLLPGETTVCEATYAVTQADLDAGFVTNNASATGTPAAGTLEDPVDLVTVQGTQTPALDITKLALNSDFAMVGDTIDYTYEVTNVGNTTIIDAISVSDDKISNVTCPTLPTGGLAPTASITCEATYAVTQADIDAGAVTNIASATDGNVTSPTDTVTVNGTQTPALSLVKTATTETYAMPGDIVSYEYVVTNSGNVTITDPISVSDDKIASVTCPALPVGGLVPNASITCTADYEATQADVDNGSVTNIASATDGNVTTPDATETVDATIEPRIEITKETTDMVQAFGPLYDVTYTINVENTGNVTLTNFQVNDDLVAALAPTTMFNTPVVSVSNITGASANTSYNGATDTNLLSGTPVMNVGDRGAITITVRVDTTNGAPAQPNTAASSASELTGLVPSNPAYIEPVDVDGDGAPDGFESCTEDRDGDGIPDCEDYDPTGYFYCEENGQIMPGGGITVTGPNGSNSVIGSANNIVIVQDGSNGFFQFYVTQTGTYTLTPTYPTSGVPSTDRLPEGMALDVTSLLPNNPAILGSSEVGSSGVLADYSAATNTPFYFEFDIEAGDPNVLMNNIPLQHCGRPELSLAKTVIGAPVVNTDGSQVVTYEFEVTNTGETQVDNVQITDDLGNVYGDPNVIVNTNEITTEPATYAGSENTGYDGVTDINLLDGLGSLEAGEALTVQVQTTVIPQETGTFINKATVGGDNPLTGGPVDPADATASVDLIPAAKVEDLVITKSVRPRTVQIGDPVLYTIEVTNNGIGNISDLEIVDNIPAGFAYVPNSATLSDASASANVEPTVATAGSLVWDVNSMQSAPLDYLAPGETISVNLRLLAGPNVDFGAHENQAYASNTETGERTNVATAVVDYIPEPTFDCTPVIGRVYDDVNHNGYPDDGEPGLPGVRLVTVNGDIITTDHFGRYHIPCAIIADSEHGSNFLLKTDVRTLPLGFTPTTENPRVVRATRGKFVKLNFGAAFRPKLRMDIYAADFDRGLLTQEAARRIREVMSSAQTAERALVVYHANDEQDVDQAQANLTLAMKVIEELAPRTLKDIALEASWDDQIMDEDGENGILYASKAMTREDDKRVNFVSDWRGGLKTHDPVKPTTRGGKGSKPLAEDDRDRTVRIFGRQDHAEEQSARPGRLQRWVGWADTMSSYAEGPEVETTVDSLDPVKRLNAQANVVATPEGRMVMAEAYHNYNAFTEKLEVRLFDADRSVRGEPMAVMAVTDGYAKLAVDNRWPEDLVYVLRAYGTDGDFDETAPKRLLVGSSDHDLTPEGWSAEKYTAFGQNTLVKDNVTVRGGAVRVYGRNITAKEVGVMGQRVRVDESGRFVAEQLLPAGQQQVELWLPGMDAGVNRTVRMVDVKSRDTFYVAQAEATIGQRQSDDDTFTDGRLAFYVRSRLNDRWAFTATADTGEAPIEDLLKGLDDKDVTQLLRRLDPDKYYPVYGDDSTIEQDAPTSGRIYARLERDDDYLLWGNYQTNFNDTEFGRIQRTLYGAKFHWDENSATRYGDARTAVTAYLAEGGTRQGRDELQGTGGSVYYLRHGDISIGSEILRIETRDVVSGLVLESRRLTYGTDYDMDFIQGRVILNRPLSSTSNDGRLFRDGNLSGNAEILVADYEFTPIAGSEDATIYGARANRWLGDLVKLGATYNKGDNNGAESELIEFDATLQLAAGTYIKGEIAQSSGQGVETYRSIDGGFSYNPIERGGNLTDDNDAMAYAIEAATDLEDMFDADGRIHAYWRKREAGFAGYAESTNKDIEQYGGGMRLNVFDELSLQARADIIEDDTIGTNSFAEASAEYALNDKISVAAGVSYSDDDRGNKGTSVGARAEYTFDDDSKIYVFGQAGIDGDNVRTTDRAGVGGEWRIGQRVFLGGEVSGGEDGLGARISGRYAEEDGDEYYLAYDLPLNSQVGAEMGTFNIGGRHRFSDALSVYGEERFMFNERGLGGLTHAYGVDYKPGNWRFGLSGELGNIGDLERQAVSATAGFNDDRMQAGATAEYREDENTNSGDVRRTWLLRTTALYQMNDELRLQGKLNWAHSDQPSGPGLVDDFLSAEFTEASVAAAYRPIWDDRLNVLAKATYLYDLSPSTQRFNGEAVDFRQKSSIYSVDASYDFHPRWTLGAKYGHRSGYVTDSRESEDFFESSADLGVIRLDYHLTHRWDATLEGRYLDIGNGITTREGGLAMLYRHINDNAKIGVGLTYGGIDQEYLLAKDDEDIGWLVNVVGKF